MAFCFAGDWSFSSRPDGAFLSFRLSAELGFTVLRDPSSDLSEAVSFFEVDSLGWAFLEVVVSLLLGCFGMSCEPVFFSCLGACGCRGFTSCFGNLLLGFSS